MTLCSVAMQIPLVDRITSQYAAPRGGLVLPNKLMPGILHPRPLRQTVVSAQYRGPRSRGPREDGTNFSGLFQDMADNLVSRAAEVAADMAAEVAAEMKKYDDSAANEAGLKPQWWHEAQGSVEDVEAGDKEDKDEKEARDRYRLFRDKVKKRAKAGDRRYGAPCNCPSCQKHPAHCTCPIFPNPQLFRSCTCPVCLNQKLWTAHQHPRSADSMVAVDVEEREDSYYLAMDVPGLQKSDLKIQVSQMRRVMTISGERRRVEGEPLEDAEGRKFNRRYERRMGKFERTVKLRKDVDATTIAARVDKGVLHVTAKKLPKEESNTDAVEIPIE